jgi:hypothetical protein
MSPINKTHISLATALLCAFALWNCGSDSHESSTVASLDETASVKLNLKYKAPPLLDSLVLDCYGTDTLHYVHSIDNALFNMDLFPGDNWKFKAKIYANGALMQVGEIETRLTAGTTASLSIQMHPVVGFVYVEVPLGLKNEAGVANGKMTLSSGNDLYEIPMETTANGIVFKSGMLGLGREYNVVIALLDSDGAEIYKVTDKFSLTEDSPVPSLTLNSLRSKVAVSIETADERLVEITVPLKASFRSPHNEDLLITEFFASPDSKDSSQYEFVEIYNGTIDTLILDDCTLGVLNSGSIKYVPLTVSEIAPQQALVLGENKNENTVPQHVNTDGWTALVGTKSSIVLKCNGETIDSLYYSTSPDSTHTNIVPISTKNGISTQLNIETWKNRSDSTAWCMGTPTPGVVKFCD